MSRPGGVNLPPGFNPKDPAYKKFANKLPRKENCNLDDPKEMFLWMLVALPGVNGGHQAMPSSYNMLVSERLYQLGAMLRCPECGFSKVAELEYVPPSSEEPHWLTSPGRWLKPDDVPESDKDAIDTAIDSLAIQQRAALLKRMKEREKEGEL